MLLVTASGFACQILECIWASFSLSQERVQYCFIFSQVSHWNWMILALLVSNLVCSVSLLLTNFFFFAAAASVLQGILSCSVSPGILSSLSGRLVLLLTFLTGVFIGCICEWSPSPLKKRWDSTLHRLWLLVVAGVRLLWNLPVSAPCSASVCAYWECVGSCSQTGTGAR